MRKLNNRGFAISTLLYGLMIMSLLVVLALFGNLSTNRHNTVTFVDKVEDELNRLSVTNTEGGHTGGEVDAQGREYIAPESGWYKIELWGAAGYGSSGGKGAYVSGIIYLEDNDHLYFYVGEQGKSSGTTFNSGTTKGGGATDVRLISGDWNDTDSKNSRIMVAGGGGSAGNGGAIAGQGSSPGTQTVGNASSTGGGGYDGSTSTGGGSSYIAGYAGVRSSTGDTSREFEVHRGEYNADGSMKLEKFTPVIYNGMMIAGVNSGAGKFKITKVSNNDISNPPRRGSNPALNNVRYIRDCVTGSSSGTNVANWLEIQAIKDGVRQTLTYVGTSGGTLASDKRSIINDGKADAPGTYATINGSGKKCVTYRLDSTMNLDEIAVWHNYSYTSTSSRVTGHELSVKSDSGNWVPLRKVSTDTSSTGQQNEYETSDGIRYNTFQYDSTGALPEGNYYIFSSASDNKVLTLKQEGDTYVVTLELFTGEDSQMWRVYKNGSYYHIQNTQAQKDFIVLDSNTSLVYLNDPDFSANIQNLTINPLGNGYYTISPVGTSNIRVGYTSVTSTALYSLTSSSNHFQRWKFVVASY